MNNTMKTKMAVMTLTGILGCSQAYALGDFEAGIGYMDRSERAFGFGKIQGVLFEGSTISHKIGLEYIGYNETLDASLDTDISYSAVVLNYELELRLNNVFSIIGGAGVGGQHASIDSPVGELDGDYKGYAQIFAGARAKISENLEFKAGVRQMYFQDYELLGVSGISQEDTLAFDMGFTFRF
jgi:opacity protein-like surface antigen